jgi:DNA-binding CsgD family transcriptional regulator
MPKTKKASAKTTDAPAIAVAKSKKFARSKAMRAKPHPSIREPIRAPDATVQEHIHRLWDELATFEAADGEDALTHLLTAVAQIIGADNSYWMGAVRVTEDARDPLLGWRPRFLRYLQPLPNDETFTKQRVKSVGRGVVDEATAAHARLAGTYRASRLRDLVSDDWFRSEMYQGYLGRGVHDSLVVGAPVSSIAEVYYGFFRMRPNDPFTEDERDTALYAMRGLTWFHRRVLLGHGLLAAASPLTPMERRVTALLLTDRAVKRIASDLDVSASTMHTYVRDILRKFGVSGRAGLVALWLGGQV